MGTRTRGLDNMTDEYDIDKILRILNELEAEKIVNEDEDYKKLINDIKEKSMEVK
jgi:hypothetical protein